MFFKEFEIVKQEIHSLHMEKKAHILKSVKNETKHNNNNER